MIVANENTNRGISPASKANDYTRKNGWRHFTCINKAGKTVEIWQMTGNGGDLMQVVDGSGSVVKAVSNDTNATFESTLAYARANYTEVQVWYC